MGACAKTRSASITSDLVDASALHARGELVHMGLALSRTRQSACLQQECIHLDTAADAALQEAHRVGVRNQTVFVLQILGAVVGSLRPEGEDVLIGVSIGGDDLLDEVDGVWLVIRT